MTVQEMTPREIDTELARLWEAEQVARSRALQARDLAAKSWNRNPEKDTLRAEQHEAEATAFRSEARVYETEFKTRGGWLRYFLVTNSNGHVHRGMECSTCFASTSYAWLVELADCDEGEMIVEFGEKACTVCFPDAPSNPAFHAPGRRDAEAIAARAAEKESKRAAKAAKLLDRPVSGPYGSVVTSKIGARNELSTAVQNFGWYGPSHPTDFAAFARDLIDALKDTDIDVEPVIERAAKKAIREGGSHDFRTVR